jgi:hypothetical protein
VLTSEVAMLEGNIVMSLTRTSAFFLLVVVNSRSYS